MSLARIEWLGVRRRDSAAWGVRARQTSGWREVGKVVGLLYTFSGVILLLAVHAMGAPLERPAPALVLTAGLLPAGLAHIWLAYKLPDDQIVRAFVPLTLVSNLLAGPWTALLLWSTGFAAYGEGAASYVAIIVMNTWLLTRPMLAVALAEVAVAHALVLATTPGVVAPVGQWAWLVATLVMVSAVVGGLVNRLDHALHAEAVARAELAGLNATLEQQVAEQVAELERLGRLRRFLSAPVADALLSSGDERVLEAHRREIAVLFCDLRGFTAFSRSVEPEEVIGVLDAYYKAVGARFDAYHATVGAYEGDGVMAFLNDPLPCDRPALRVVEMARDISTVLDDLVHEWQGQDYDLGYGIGVAMGHATLGLVGFEGRTDYTALGNVVNLAARLCSVAGRGQIVVDRRVQRQAMDEVVLEPLPPVSLKGFAEPVPVYELPRPRPSPDAAVLPTA